MTREADYTLKGFVYQFNKTLEKLLSEPEGSEIKVEGIIEDIDIVTGELTKAIQCKYHETKNKYSISDIAKPLLQMLVHYSKNQNKNIQYILYAYFPNERPGEKIISKENIESILKTTNTKYIADYISQLKPPNNKAIEQILTKPKRNADDLKNLKDFYKTNLDLTLSIDIADFLQPAKFKFIIGYSFEDLIKETKTLLKNNSIFSKKDIEDLFYPNAIQLIAEKSILHDHAKRILQKKSFIKKLEEIKKVAITRWTKELFSYKALLKNRKAQLKINLLPNHRLRYFLFNSDNIEDFKDGIINFISDYLNKYHNKIKLHTETPLFGIETTSVDLIKDVESRLHVKDINYENGYRGNKFFQNTFLKEPARVINNKWFEFNIRLCQLNQETIAAINKNKCTDMFLIGRIENNQLDLKDINIEKLDVSNFKELRYLLSLTDRID